MRMLRFLKSEKTIPKIQSKSSVGRERKLVLSEAWVCVLTSGGFVIYKVITISAELQGHFAVVLTKVARRWRSCSSFGFGAACMKS